MAKYFTKEGDNYNEVEAFSQEQIDEITGDSAWLNKRLEREREKFTDYDDLKAKAATVDTVKSEYETKLQDSTTKIGVLEKQVGTAKLETDKVKIVNEFKLSEDLAEFVTGDNAEEMRKRAEKLAKGVKPSKVTVDKTGKPSGSENSDSKAMAGKLFGRKSGD